jgi:hypothetical protein
MKLSGVFGNIVNPYGASGFNIASYQTGQGGGLIIIISNLYRLAIVLAGIYTLINLVLAGYGYLSAGGDAKLVQKSQERIWRSIIGLVIVASSLLIAAIIGYIIFGPVYWNILFSPRVFTPP